ncbi:hypothetical protein MNV49_004043 [Pseudohyphozyma bogoriensis]|nr:hypothetical protein MNV49_004043 [Pseudohyphozyma bogoriensis]
MYGRVKETVDRARAFIKAFPATSRWPTILAQSYCNLSEAQRTCLGIIGLQAAVFAVWHVPIPALARLYPWLVHDPLAKGRAVTLLTSIFSHQTPMHFLFNSLAFYSFGPTTIEWLQAKLPRREDKAGPRSTSRYEFVAFFVAAGLFSSLGSHVWSARVLYPRLQGLLRPSLGASGAIYSAVSITALAYPEASVSLIFFPFFPIPIGTAYWSMVAFDAVGLVRGWKMFDHAAHLSGAVFGLLYYSFGHHYFEQFRAWLKSVEPNAERRRVEGVGR